VDFVYEADYLTICSTCRKHFPVLSSFMTFHVPLVQQELPILPEHLSSPPIFSEVHVTRSLVLCVCFVDRCLSFCTFPFGHCVVCSSSIYGFWLPLWYLQTLLPTPNFFVHILYFLSRLLFCLYTIIFCVYIFSSFHCSYMWTVKQRKLSVFQFSCVIWYTCSYYLIHRVKIKGWHFT